MKLKRFSSSLLVHGLFFFVLTAIIPAATVAAASSSSSSSGIEGGPLNFLPDLPSLSLSVSLSASQELSPLPFFDSILGGDRGRREEEEEEESPSTAPPSTRPHLTRGAGVKQAGSWRDVSRRCLYTVIVKTSCSSPRVTRDMVSLAFGDGYGREVYRARLDDPATGTFERCSTDTFRMAGPCGSRRTCYLYLRRRGPDGWKPESVAVYSQLGAANTVSFFYDTPLPEGIFYGFNFCHGYDNSGNRREVERKGKDRTKRKMKAINTSTIRLI